MNSRKSILSLIVIAAAIGGCAGPNWPVRVGKYSFDDANREYGPPDKCDALKSRGRVCSWTTPVGNDWLDTLTLVFDANDVLVSSQDMQFPSKAAAESRGPFPDF